jgi:hypothetical protein
MHRHNAHFSLKSHIYVVHCSRTIRDLHFGDQKPEFFLRAEMPHARIAHET